MRRSIVIASLACLTGCTLLVENHNRYGVMDAGLPRLDSCVAQSEVCNGEDDDCDGTADEAEAQASCEPMPGGANSVACIAGRCAVATCAPDRDDCDDIYDNGCETDLAQPEHCGGCDVTCAQHEACRDTVCTTRIAWVEQFGGTRSDGATSISVVSYSAIVAVAGTFDGGATIAGQALTSANDNPDGFVAAYSYAGEHRWLSHYAADSAYVVPLLAPSQYDQLCGVGSLSGSAMSVDGLSVASDGSGDLFFVCHSPLDGIAEGLVLFSALGSQFAMGVAYRRRGGVQRMYAVGSYRGTLDLGTGTTEPNRGMADGFLIGLNPAMPVPPLSVTTFGSAQGDAFRSLMTDANGNVFACGVFYETIDIGDATLSSAGGSDIIVASFDDTGNVRWAIPVGGLGDDSCTDIDVDLAGTTVLVAGRFSQQVQLGPDTLTAAGTSDAFVAAFDASTGAALWGLGIGGAGEDYASEVEQLSDGRIALLGTMQADVIAGAIRLDHVSDADGFLLLLSEARDPIMGLAFAGPGDDRLGLLAASGARLFVAGEFSGDIQVGDQTLTSAGGSDGVIFAVDVD